MSAANAVVRPQRFALHDDGINNLACIASDDGTCCYVATASDDKTVKIHKISVHEPRAFHIHTAFTCTGATGQPTSVAMCRINSPTNSISIAVGTSSHKIYGYLIDTAAEKSTYEPLLTYTSHTDEIASISLTTMCKRVLMGSIDDSGTFILWDFLNGAVLCTERRAHDVLGSVVAFSPIQHDSTPETTALHCITGGFDQKVTLWKLQCGLASMAAKPAEEESVSILVGKSAKKSKNSDKTAKMIETLSCSAAKVMSWTAGQTSGVVDSAVKHRDVRKGDKTRVLAPLEVKAAAKTADKLTTIEKVATEEGSDDAADGKILNPAFVYSVAWLVDGVRFAVAFGNGTVALYDTVSGLRISTHNTFTQAATCISAVDTVEGTVLWAAANDGSVQGLKVAGDVLVASASQACKHSRGPNALTALPIQTNTFAVVDTRKSLFLYTMG